MFKFDSKKISKNPGVYLFKDEKSTIVYIGKAKNLKNRVKSYFLENNDRLYKKHLIVDDIFDIETIVTNSEKEALILESNLIKKYRPKYNVLLKDNSEYCFLKIDNSSKLYLPEISIVRRKTENDFDNLKNKRNKDVVYFGPYTSKKNLLDTLRLLSKTFSFQCLKIKNINNKYKANENVILSPCFNYHIKRCAGICCGKITRDEYREIIKNIISFFNGNIKELSEYLDMKMRKFSKDKKYEEALKYKNKIELLESIVDKQYMRTEEVGEIETVNVYLYDTVAVINLFNIKNGVLLNKKNYIIQLNDSKIFYNAFNDDATEELYKQNILEEFIEQYCASFLDFSVKKTFVLFNDEYIDRDIFKAFNIEIRKFKNDNEKRLLELGEENSVSYINKDQINSKVLEKIKDKLELNKIPKRIECFDISNIQGKFAVGSMSVLIDGLSDKKEYRKFKIRLKNEPNDVMMMREVLEEGCL